MAIVRDLVGYGRQRPDIVWPNGARVAVSLVLNFEEGAELGADDLLGPITENSLCTPAPLTDPPAAVERDDGVRHI